MTFALSDIITYLSPVVFLYPEIHYVFKWLPFSRYRIGEPEIIADAPYRVEPNRDLPVLLLVKDADKHPVKLTRAVITLSGGSNTAVHEIGINDLADSPWWRKIFNVKIPPDWRGQVLSVDVQIDYQIGGNNKTLHNDNCFGLSHDRLKVLAAKDPTPAFENWFQGDLHFHTDYTSDQVEFGAPMDASVEMAYALGLSFFAATDHSYDLDDYEDNYLLNDPVLKKWKRSREEIKTLNKVNKDRMVIIPGEEVSCSNEEGRNVHCLVLDHDDFLPGSGDSAERWFRTDAELTIGDVAKKVSSSGLMIAAHPKDPVPLLEKILIRRGQWTDTDCRTKGISGLQILNGLDNGAFTEGLAQWVRQLRDGSRSYIFAGNDAHGNFNRYRQVKIPMLQLNEIENHQAFGWARTVVWLDQDALTVKNIIKHLRCGHAVVSNGPLTVFTVHNENGEIFRIGETATGNNFKLMLRSKSNAALGSFSEIKVIAGQIGKAEAVVDKFQSQSHFIEHEFTVSSAAFSYFRCEARTFENLFCYTNPIWIEKR